jgi:acetyl-CoA acyltransferase
LKQAGLSINDIGLIELNEALPRSHWRLRIRIKSDIVNVNGGAIAMGHPLGCTGAKLSVQLFDEMKRRGENMELLPCVGTGQGSAGVYELM